MKDFLSKTFGREGFLKLFSKDTSVLGIDVGASSLKIIQIRKEKEQALLETYGELSTSAYTGGEAGRAVLLADEKVSEMIVDLKREAGATATHGLISIPLRHSFITVIEMPTLSDDQMAEAVPFEARRYIPIPLSDVMLDWWRIPDRAGATKKTMSVLLAAVQREVIEKYTRILSGAGITSLGFEVEVFSATRVLGTRSQGAILLFDIGALSTKLSIVEAGIIRAVHHVDRGSQSFTLTISQSLGIDFKRAEEMKHTVGISQRPEAAGVRHTITPLLDSLFDEADRLRTSFRRKFGEPIDKAVMLGGGCLMPGLADYAIERLGIEVLISNPFSQMVYPAFLQPTLKSIGPAFSTSSGLAIRGLGAVE